MKREIAIVPYIDSGPSTAENSLGHLHNSRQWRIAVVSLFLPGSMSRHYLFLVALLLAGLSIPSIAFAENPNAPHMLKAVAGDWVAREGGREARVHMDGRGNFRGTIVKAGKTLWRFNGSYEVQQNRFIWRYAGGQSGKPTTVDRDRILAFDGNRLMLMEKNGKITQFFRKR